MEATLGGSYSWLRRGETKPRSSGGKCLRSRVASSGEGVDAGGTRRCTRACGQRRGCRFAASRARVPRTVRGCVLALLLLLAEATRAGPGARLGADRGLAQADALLGQRAAQLRQRCLDG